jgi:hypothetical protein
MKSKTDPKNQKRKCRYRSRHQEISEEDGGDEEIAEEMSER